MAIICAVLGCKSRSGRDDVSFFRIPSIHKGGLSREKTIDHRILERRKSWIQVLNRENLEESTVKNQRICSKHFVTGKPASIEERNHPDWIPTLRLGYGEGSSDLPQSKVQASESVESHEKDDHQESSYSSDESTDSSNSLNLLPPLLLDHNYCQRRNNPMPSNPPTVNVEEGVSEISSQQSLSSMPSPPLSPPPAGVANFIESPTSNDTPKEDQQLDIKEEQLPDNRGENLVEAPPTPSEIIKEERDAEIKEEPVTETNEDPDAGSKEEPDTVIKEESDLITPEASDTIMKEPTDTTIKKQTDISIKEEPEGEITVIPDDESDDEPDVIEIVDLTIDDDKEEVNDEPVLIESSPDEKKRSPKETIELDSKDVVTPKEENVSKGTEEKMTEDIEKEKEAPKKNEESVKKEVKSHATRNKKASEEKNLAQEVEDSITRCICGFQHDDGFMICCDKCMVWQHVDCMEIERSNIPDEYLCEKCSPRKVDRIRATSLQRSKKKLFDEVMKTSAADTPPSSSSDQSNSDGENVGGRGHRRRKENRTGTVKKMKPSPTPKVNLVVKKKKEKAPKRLVKSTKREETSDIEEEEDDESDAEDLRSWIETYEEAITNHYSPELRARVSVLRANGIGSEEKLVGAHSARPKSKVHSAFSQKMLVAACNIQNNAPIVEIRGKYMLARGGLSPSSKIPERFIFHHHISAPGPLTTDVLVDTSTFGNSARFIRSSCNPNAQIKHCIEKGVLHLYIVSSQPIEIRQEITLPHRAGSDCALASKCHLLSNAKRRNRKQVLVERSVSRYSTSVNNNNYKEVPAKKRSLSSERPISSKALKTSNGASLNTPTEESGKNTRSKPTARSSVSANLRRSESKPNAYSTYKP